MKNSLILAVIFLTFYACDGGAPTSDVQAVDLTNFELTDMQDGYKKAVRVNGNGKLLEEGMLRGGKRNGIWVVYQTNKPIPASVANFVNDEYSGVYMQYSNLGQLELICHYKANQLDGPFTRFKNSRILEEGQYLNGQYEGEYRKYYAGKDVLQQTAEYKDGRLHGTSKFYNESGQVVMEYKYENGEKISGGIVENGGKGK